MGCSDAEFNFSESVNLWTFYRIPFTGDQPATNYIEQHDTENAVTHPSLERNLNPRSPCSGGRRQYVP